MKSLPSATNPLRRYSRFRLSLRVLIVLVLLLGSYIGWIAFRARNQRQAGAAIENSGGKVRYDWEAIPGQPQASVRRWLWPVWLTKLLGPDLFGYVVWVGLPSGDMSQTDDSVLAQIGHLDRLEELDFAAIDIGARWDSKNSKLTDTSLMHLKGLHHLRRLNLTSTGVQGAGLAHLKGLACLENLQLFNIPVTDSDLTNLAGLNSLEILSINSDQISDVGLSNIKGLTRLRQLKLISNQITNKGLANLSGFTRLEYLLLRADQLDSLEYLPYLPTLRRLTLLIYAREQLDPLDFKVIRGADLANLRKFTNLRILNLSSPSIDDSVLPYIASLTNLTELRLAGTRITNSGLGLISGLKQLETLDLGGTAVSDEGLKYLEAMVQLGELRLSYTQVTDAGLASLQRLVNCRTLEVTGTSVTPEGLEALREYQTRIGKGRTR